jgi:NTE family protein
MDGSSSTRCEKTISPVESVDTHSSHRDPEPGIALCLSGGGYRAMLFHAGALWRLNELGYLPKLARISSVSGGSIAAGLLGARWQRLRFDADGVAGTFEQEIVAPLRQLAGRTLDATALAGGILLPGSVADYAAAAYRRHLVGDATLQDLPCEPRFVLTATNVQSGALWRFMKPYMRDYRVGEVRNPTIGLAVAIAASAAFPPFLSPVVLELDEAAYTKGSGLDLQCRPFTTDVVLTDGGVYDNLGLETAWKRYQTILVSDAGGQAAVEAEPARDWIGHTIRALTLITDQLATLRRRQVVQSLRLGLRSGTYWGVRTDISHYGLADALDCPVSKTTELADVPTRLKRLEDDLQERLVDWGYAVCDAAMRRHVLGAGTAPASQFPYGIGVG